MRNKVEEYLANDWEDAVVKAMSNGDRYVRFFRNGTAPQIEKEFKAHPESKVAHGDIGNDLIKISKEEYDTFGKTWHFGSHCERTYIVL